MSTGVNFDTNVKYYRTINVQATFKRSRLYPSYYNNNITSNSGSNRFIINSIVAGFFLTTNKEWGDEKEKKFGITQLWWSILVSRICKYQQEEK